MHREQARSIRRGFTLVELLVVIGIIAVLVGILLPTLASARRSANSAACLSNLRQIGVFNLVYVNQSNGFLPFHKAPTYDTTAFPPGWLPNKFAVHWFQYLSVIGRAKTVNAHGIPSPVESMAIIKSCPTYVNNSPPGQVNTRPGYGMNTLIRMPEGITPFPSPPGWTMQPNIGDWNNPMKITQLKRGAQRIVNGDSNDWHLQSQNDNFTVPDYFLVATDGHGYFSGDPKRHGKSANYLFCDGHAESLQPALAAHVLRYADR